MKLRTLESVPYDTLHRAFRSAFADYAVPFELGLEQLREMHRRRGVRPDLSVGSFDGDDLVAFTFNGFGDWRGARSGYDAGTGVVASHRGQGVASDMMQRSLELLRDAGATRYVLEVLQSNAAAFRVYERLGFEVTRELLCWTLDRPARRPNSTTIVTTATIDRPPDEMWDWSPSWQNSSDSIRRTSEPRTVLLAKLDDRAVGYAIVFPSGDLAQFAVAKDCRRQGVGTALINAAREASENSLRIINTDAGDSGASTFLQSIGAEETVRQYEMALSINRT